MSLFRPNIERLHGYVPGEQPQDAGWIKLNTNENPYPPSPLVVDAIRTAATSRLNLYPDPLGTAFRQAAAELFGVTPDWILPANGSDENLTILFRSFVGDGETVAFPYPTYILYETLAELQAARSQRILLKPDWTFDSKEVAAARAQARMVIAPNPNSPSGNRWSADELLPLIPDRGVLVLDEAYGDFADPPHRGELLHTPAGQRIIMTRSFSKSYSLAGIRFGFAIAHPDLIAGMRKVKDSYNCDAVALAAATAAIRDQAWMQANVARIRASRAWLQTELSQLGFDVIPSQANFVWTTHRQRSHKELHSALKSRRILVRHMIYADVPWAPGGTLDGLRITIGTDDELRGLIAALREIV